MTKKNKKVEPSFHLGSDIPQVDPVCDAFGYAPFAKMVAGAIVKTQSPQGLVMAIHGPWGAGKSSLINFVKHYLKSDFAEKAPAVIDFNPWWFDDRKQLAGQFLNQFKSALKIENKTLRDAGDLMSRYSDALGKVVAVSTGYPLIDKLVSGLLKLLNRKPQDVPKIKGEIAAALKKGDRRFLIVIDDIDRLTPDEIREVFKVVKALADFPNIVYMLSFDRSVVADALLQSMKVDGESYLEKIIQVSFVLPVVEKRKLQQKLFFELDLLIEGADLQLLDQTYWGNVFVEGMAPFFTKPRDVIRYINAVAVTFPALRNEVNITDFFALEALRMFLPELYETIRDNQRYFTGTASNGIKSHERTEERLFHEAWTAKIPEDVREGVRSMLVRIFPRLDDMGRGGDVGRNWRKSRRAAHSDVFTSYFQFSIDSDSLSKAAMDEFVLGLNSQEHTEATLLKALSVKRVDGSSMTCDYLDHLQDYNKEISPDCAKKLIFALLNIGDHLILKSDQQGGLMALPAEWRVGFAISHAADNVTDGQLDAVLIDGAQGGESLVILSLLIAWIEDSKAKPKDHGSGASFCKVKDATVEALKKIAANRIERFAADGTLIDKPKLLSLLYRWRSWSGEDSPKKWATSFVQSPDALLKLLARFMSETRTQSFGDSVGRVTKTLNLKHLADFLNIEEVNTVLINNPEPASLDDDLRSVQELFFKQYKFFTEGKDPDSPFARMGLDED